ncbi:Type VI secretion protein [Vibrio harveyi]|uniref:type VI secretion system protein TssA n=1 Tax=Vibrio harveyi TaxID=669 RepID=UPI001EFE03A4|nr:type VI secretion system protein TssA [Vibrio harveyi]EKO3808634.1 type VI secretion system protein TssA [Vibrio harveyi]MCG9237445.1 type VI secretion system protein TssA [Vibrio harveyi]MCG9589275.1 type VI secretion system protein TssA [Vibrio harveyi]CAH1234323.1 Type VI secretion protein [Vibrio harveyi]CAH1556848.1 Type VI secretion protein [Vibrio harveyi]
MSVIEIERLLAPISDSAPVGEDARYEFCYEMMESEVKKFGSLFGETVDWSVVKTHATEVLEHHSKDLKAICYLVRALTEEFGLQGFEQGLKLLSEALNRFGVELYPSRKRGRDGAVEWLNHQFKLVSSKLAESPQSWELVSSCISTIEDVQRQYDDVYQDSEADFFEIRTQLNVLSQQVAVDNQSDDATATLEQATPAAQSAKAEVVETPAQSEVQTTSSNTVLQTSKPAAVKKAVTKEVDIDTDFSSPTASKRTLKKVAEVMLHANPSDPLAYRIYRHLTWDDIDGLPDHQNNQTPLSLAVSSDQQTEYRDKANQESDIDTIKRLERTLTDAPFWLTGHYLVSLMLNNLGFDDAAIAVKQEVKRFVDSLEGIEYLTFKNSLPFADEATLSWLSTQDATSSSSQPVVQTVVISEEDSLPMEDITLENLGEYAAELARKLELDSSGRGQFMLYLQLIAAYQSVGLYPLCLPYLEKGWEVQKAFNLASWEPHLSSQLEDLIRKTLHQLFRSKDLLPEKYEEWKAIYD